VAQALDRKQSAMSRIERCENLYVSTLRDDVYALGDELTLIPSV
jgi:hypothetical protein